MVSEKQRRRALARAKWERQQARRLATERRNRTARIIAGALVTVVVLGFVGWGIHHLVTNSSNDNQPIVPVLPSNTLTMKTPTNGSFVTSFSPGKPTTPTIPTTAPTTGPVTTQTTGKASP